MPRSEAARTYNRRPAVWWRGADGVQVGGVRKRAAPRRTKKHTPLQLKPQKPRTTPLTCPICPICMCHIQQNEVVATVCGHIFCRDCLQQCLRNKKACPHCRRIVNNKDYHAIFLSDNDDVDIEISVKEEDQQLQTVQSSAE